MSLLESPKTKTNEKLFKITFGHGPPHPMNGSAAANPHYVVEG